MLSSGGFVHFEDAVCVGGNIFRKREGKVGGVRWIEQGRGSLAVVQK